MKVRMNSLQRNNWYRWKKTGALVFLGLVITLFRGPLGYGLTTAFTYLAKPLWAARDFAGEKAKLGLEYLSKSKAELIEENLKLNREIESLIVTRKRLALVEAENDNLKASLGHSQSGEKHLANILSSLLSSPYDTFVIDQGSLDGVQFGQKIVSEAGVLLGEVIEVYPRISKVELFSAFDKELEVVLESGDRVVIRGEGSQNFFIRLPRGVAVFEGAALSYPGNHAYVIATIEHVENEPGDAFQKIYARNPVNIHGIKVVYVIE